MYITSEIEISQLLCQYYFHYVYICTQKCH